MKKALIITGPTATGKTALALEVAQHVNGALISADSIQVYKNCDIISGKDIPPGTKFEIIEHNTPPQFTLGYYSINNTPLYLTDVVEPTYDFSVADFLDLTARVLGHINKEGKLPIFVGGTTLYIKALLEPIDTLSSSPDPVLRDHLANASVEDLQTILAKYDKEKLAAMNESDINNPRRLIRAIEISKSPKARVTDNKFNYNFKTIGLELDRQNLREKIDKRVESRLNEGALDEAKSLFDNYNNLSDNIKKANGYRQLFEYLKNEISQSDAIEKWRYSEYLHAKNQMTFFRKIKEIQWFDVAQDSYPESAILAVKNWLSSEKIT